VAAASFSTARRGYDQNEVRELLRMVAAELGRLQEREKFLERELRASQNSPHTPVIALDEEVVTKMLGEEAARILQTAREASTQIKIRAEDGAARLLREATDEAQRIREESEVEASRRRTDASADAEAELQMSKQQGRDMVNEARAYRERVLGELARRRELARQQIEQLVHGRDRLLQAFERARLAAVDVMSELAPLGTPTEYVNLSPTTGPVPVMIPAAAHQPPPVVVQSADEMLAEVDALVPAPTVDEPEPRQPAQVELATVDPARADSKPDGAAAAESALEDFVTDDSERVDHVAPSFVTDDSAGEAANGRHREAPAAHEPVDETVVLLRDPHVTAAPPTDDDHRESAPVVALFAGELDRRRSRHGVEAAETTEPAETAQPGDAEPAEAAEPSADSVDSLFAKLRASRMEDVAKRANDAADQTAMLQRADRSDVDAAQDSVFHATQDEPAADAEIEATPFGMRDAELTPLIISAARRIKRVLADEQNELLHTLRRNATVTSVEELLATADEQRGRYASAITGELEKAAFAGAASVAVDGAKPKKPTIKKDHAIEPALSAMETALLAPLRDRVARAISDVDGDAEELGAHVRGIYREWKTQRIDEHLDDIARLAYGRGQLLALAPGTPVCWIVDPNGPACPDAEDNSLAGTVIAGQPFPTEHIYPPAHPGCRCLLARAEAETPPR